MRTRRLWMQEAAGLTLAATGWAAAQELPARPMRIVVPAAAGGNLDNVSRIVAQKLADQIGQQVLVENRPGGSYKLAVDYVSKLPADGGTLLAIADSFLYSPLIVRTPSYDALKDFVGVGLVATVPQILVVHPSVEAKSAAELIALARRRPGELSYGSSGNGATGHIAAELFATQAGITMTHVPYRGNAPALVDLVGGRLTLMFDTISTSVPHVRSGGLKALGVTSLARSPLLPQVPTVAESGLPGYEAVIFNGFVALAGTPQPLLRRLNDELRKVVQQPELRARLQEQGVQLTASDSPEQFQGWLRAQAEKYAQLVKTAHIRAD